MKTNRIHRILAVICLLACISFYSCKKDGSASSDTTSANVTSSGDDQEQVSNEADIISNDVNTALNNQSDFSGSMSGSQLISGETGVNSTGNREQVNGLVNIHQLICDATITYDTSGGQRTLTIVYDGSNCWGNRSRNGTVTVSIPKGQRWNDAGSVCTVTVKDLKISRIRDGKSIVLNGTKTIANVSGGLLKNLASIQNITHKITGSLKVEFASGKTGTWNVSKQRVFTYNNGIVISTTGTYSDGNDSNIAEWGTNRFGEEFKSLISAPIVIRQDCDFRLVSGQHTIITNKGTSVITYGLDANGDPTVCPGTGNYYFKLVFTGALGKIYTIIWPY